MFRIWRVGLCLCRVAEAAPAGVEPGEGAPLEPPVCLGADELQKGVIHQRHRAEGEARAGAVGRHAGGAVDDAHARGREVAEDDPPGVAQVAREAREVVDEKDGERAFAPTCLG